MVESYSLLEPDACANMGRDGEVETTVYGEIVQIKQDRMIPVFTVAEKKHDRSVRKMMKNLLDSSPSHIDKLGMASLFYFAVVVRVRKSFLFIALRMF